MLLTKQAIISPVSGLSNEVLCIHTALMFMKLPAVKIGGQEKGDLGGQI